MIQSLRHLEGIVGYDRQDIFHVINNLEKYRYSFLIPKSDNRFREIAPSLALLKDIQNRLKDRVFSNVTFPYYVIGSTKRRCGILNAKLHSGTHYHFKTDISSYFDFINYKQVNRALLRLGLSCQIAEVITKLVTYRGHLPQGAPTSSFIANLVGLEIDQNILGLSRAYDIIYSRYVDDMLFSSHKDFRPLTNDFLTVLRNCGFKNNQQKTFYKMGDIRATGAMTGPNGLKPTSALLEKRNSATSRSVIQGCEGFIHHIDRVHRMSVSEYKLKYPSLQFPSKILIAPKNGVRPAQQATEISGTTH